MCGGRTGFRGQNKYLDLILYPHPHFTETNWMSWEPTVVVPAGQPLGHRAVCRRAHLERSWKVLSMSAAWKLPFKSSTSINYVAPYQNNSVVTVVGYTEFES